MNYKTATPLECNGKSEFDWNAVNLYRHAEWTKFCERVLADAYSRLGWEGETTFTNAFKNVKVGTLSSSRELEKLTFLATRYWGRYQIFGDDGQISTDRSIVELAQLIGYSDQLAEYPIN